MSHFICEGIIFQEPEVKKIQAFSDKNFKMTF